MESPKFRPVSLPGPTHTSPVANNVLPATPAQRPFSRGTVVSPMAACIDAAIQAVEMVPRALSVEMLPLRDKHMERLLPLKAAYILHSSSLGSPETVRNLILSNMVTTHDGLGISEAILRRDFLSSSSQVRYLPVAGLAPVVVAFAFKPPSTEVVVVTMKARDGTQE